MTAPLWRSTGFTLNSPHSARLALADLVAGYMFRLEHKTAEKAGHLAGKLRYISTDEVAYCHRDLASQVSTQESKRWAMRIHHHPYRIRTVAGGRTERVEQHIMHFSVLGIAIAAFLVQVLS